MVKRHIKITNRIQSTYSCELCQYRAVRRHVSGSRASYGQGERMFRFTDHCILIVLSDETDGWARSNYHCIELLLWKVCWSDRENIICILSHTWKNKQNTHFHLVEYYSISTVELIQRYCIVACALIVTTHTFSFCWRSQSRIHNRSPQHGISTGCTVVRVVGTVTMSPRRTHMASLRLLCT